MSRQTVLRVMVLGFGLAVLLVIAAAYVGYEWQAGELSRVSWNLVESHEKLARRFSHEIHDELGQAMAGVKGIMKRITPEELPGQREEVLGLLDEVMSGIRELSQLLRPVILDDFGLDAGLRWLSERFMQRTRIQVDYSSNYSGRLSDELETQLFRIAQEALTNIARHSGATAATVSLSVQGGHVRMEIADNGRGMPEPFRTPHPGIGMVGMRARARQVRGEVKVENRSQGGVRVVVDTPFRGQEEDGGEENSNSAC